MDYEALVRENHYMTLSNSFSVDTCTTNTNDGVANVNVRFEMCKEDPLSVRFTLF